MAYQMGFKSNLVFVIHHSWQFFCHPIVKPNHDRVVQLPFPLSNKVFPRHTPMMEYLLEYVPLMEPWTNSISLIPPNTIPWHPLHGSLLFPMGILFFFYSRYSVFFLGILFFFFYSYSGNFPLYSSKNPFLYIVWSPRQYILEPPPS